MDQAKLEECTGRMVGNTPVLPSASTPRATRAPRNRCRFRAATFPQASQLVGPLRGEELLSTAQVVEDALGA
jgi:hypothetical protein